MLVASFSAFASILPSFPVNSPQKAQISSYAPHAPIFFSDNAGFLGSNSSTGVSWGSGTVDDPYIIEGWGIDTASGGGISISYTDVHFIIRDCYVHDVAPTRSGIYLHSSANGILINNNCSSNQNGIYLDSSSNNTLINNTCSNNKRGISIHESSNNTLINNTCSNNMDDIYIGASSDITLNNNIMVGGGIIIDGSDMSQWSTHAIDISNTVNGRPVYYYKNQNGITVPAGAGQVILANCTDSIVEGQSLTYCSVGVELVFSSGITVTNNNCSSTDWIGIYLASSIDCTVSNNNCSNNNRDIIYPDSSGIYLDSSSNNTLINNNCSNNKLGISIHESSNNTLIYNNCSSNNNLGISIHESSNNTLINNTCWNNYDGIYIYESSNNTVWNNTCNYNKLTGIHLGVSSNNTINWNNCSRNWDDGIGMWGCYGNVVYQNVVISNIDYGIDIPQGSRNRIWNNTFIGNNGATDTYNASHVQAYDNGNNNWWNSTNGYGNYWSDWTKPDNNAPYGRVDSPYNIDDGYRLDSKDGYDGHSKAKDYYPLTAPRISDPPYIPAPSDMLIPILAIAVVIIVAVILVSFIVLRKRKGETAEPPSVNQ
jgi:parallel beta-helix repeat protein